MKEVLAVTGITGKTGRALANMLANDLQMAREKFPGGLRLIARSEIRSEAMIKILPEAELHIGEFSDLHFLSTALQGVNTLVHIAGITLSPDIVRIAKLCQVRRLILVHTTGAYSKYKAAGENYRRIDEYVSKYCTDNDIILTILRPTMIYGCITDRNISTFIKMVDHLPIVPVINNARYELQPIYYEDVSRAIYLVIFNEHKTNNRDFIISGEKPIQLREMLSVIGEHLSKRVVFFNIPLPFAYIVAQAIYLLTLTKIDFREKLQRLCENRTFPNDAARIAFGFCPRSFDEGIAKEVSEYLKNKYQTGKHTNSFIG